MCSVGHNCPKSPNSPSTSFGLAEIQPRRSCESYEPTRSPFQAAALYRPDPEPRGDPGHARHRIALLARRFARMGKFDLPQLAGHRECPCKPSHRDPDLPSPAIAPSVRTTLAQLPAHVPGRQRIASDRLVELMAPGLPDVHHPDPPAVPQLALARNPPRGPEPMVAGRSMHLGLGSVPRCGPIANARSSHTGGPPNTLRKIPASPAVGPRVGRISPMHPLDDRNE